MQTGSITVMFRKVMIENENDGHDFLHGAFNTKVSSTTKFSPFHLQRLVINTATIHSMYAAGRKDHVLIQISTSCPTSKIINKEAEFNLSQGQFTIFFTLVPGSILMNQ